MSTNKNLGATTIPRKRRNANPMQEFDALPAPLRIWLSKAALPWSATSAMRIWSKAKAKGLSPNEALQTLVKAEARTLARDGHSHEFNA